MLARDRPRTATTLLTSCCPLRSAYIILPSPSCLHSRAIRLIASPVARSSRVRGAALDRHVVAAARGAGWTNGDGSVMVGAEPGDAVPRIRSLGLRLHVPVVVHGTERGDDERRVHEIEVAVVHAVTAAVMVGLEHVGVHA